MGGSVTVASSAAMAAEKDKITKYGHLLIPGDTFLPAPFETFGSTTPSVVLWFQRLAKRVVEARHGQRATPTLVKYQISQWRLLIALALFEGMAAHMAAFHGRLSGGDREGIRKIARQDVWALAGRHRRRGGGVGGGGGAAVG